MSGHTNALRRVWAAFSRAMITMAGPIRKTPRNYGSETVAARLLTMRWILIYSSANGADYDGRDSGREGLQNRSQCRMISLRALL